MGQAWGDPMTRLRAVLAAAAALVVGGGLALNVALRQAGQDLVPRMTCAEWEQVVAQAEPPIEWFVATTDAFVPPTAVGSRIIGTCAAGVCTVEPQSCPTPVTYTYERSAPVSGWRLYRVRGPKYFAVGWRALATAQPASVRFYRGWAELAADCLTHFTAANCRTLADGAGVCWKRAGNQYCRKGRLYGPGLGGVGACSPQAGDSPYPCDVTAGVDPGGLTTSSFPADQELDQ